MNLIGTDGRYVDKFGTVEHVLTTPAAGGGGAQYPPQVAAAVTLETNASRGLASKGRFYVPSPVGSFETGPGLFSISAAANLAIRATTLVEDLNEELEGWTVAVVSGTRTGAARLVNRVSVGRVLDTIRSRRTSLVEDRQAGADIAVPAFEGGGGSF